MQENRQKSKKVSTLIYLVITLISFVTLFVFGYDYVIFLYTLSNKLLIDLIIIALLIITWLILYWLQLIIHESGHLIFGLFGGYDFSSFRIGSLFISKQNGKIKFSKISVTGTGGQCLLAPPEDENKKTNPFLYLLGGGLLNMITATISLALALLITNVYAKHTLIFFAIFGFLTALTNLIPLNLQYICNDGYNLLLLSKKKEQTQKAVNFQLKVSNELTKGVAIKDMPSEWFNFPKQEELTDFLLTTKAYLCISHHIDKGNLEWVYGVIDGLLSSNAPLLGIYEVLLKGELLYIGITLNKLPFERAKELHQSLEKHYLANKNNLSLIRINYACELLINKDNLLADKLLMAFNKTAKNYPYQTEVNTENKLIALAQEVYNSTDIDKAIEKFKTT